MVFVQTGSITICTKGTSQVKLSSNLGSRMGGQSSPSLTITTLPLKDVLALDFVCLVSNLIDK
jgi:hypothetical protein